VTTAGIGAVRKRNSASVALWLCGYLFFSVSLCLCGNVSAQQPKWPSESPPKPLPARDVKFPPYELQKLPNGLQVVAVLHHEQPVVSVRLLIRAGSASDPKNKLGLAHLAANLLDQGTTTKSAEEMADAIDFIGGAMGAGAGTDLSYLNMIVMKDSFDVGMRMLSDMARHPAFAPQEIDRQRQQMLSSMRVSLDDPGYVANAVFDPYGLPQSGTPETINAITRDDLVDFQKKYFAPNNAILAIVGDVTADEAFAEAKNVFGDWDTHDVPDEATMELPEPARRVIIVNKPDAVQTEVRVGHIGVPRKNPDYMALNLAVRILGGEGSNRLHQVLRTERGLTYGAQASLDTLKRSGDIEAETNTRSEATGEVLRLMTDEFWRLQRERVGEHELADAKAYLTGSFPLTIETPDAIAMQILNVLFYELPIEQLQNFRERVNVVTVDDIQRVARVYLKPDRLSVVLVGNASAFESQLNGVGFGRFERVELGNLDLTAADFKRDGTRTGGGRAGEAGDAGGAGEAGRANYGGAGRAGWANYVSPEQQSTVVAEEGAKAKALLDRVVEAKGGLEKLRAIKTITAVTTSTAQTSMGAVEAQSTTILEYPNRVRVDTTLPQGRTIQVYDGQQAWVRDPRGVHDVDASMVRELEAGLKRDTVSLLVAAETGSVRARVLPDVKDDSGVVRHALELSGTGFEPIVLYVNPDTGLIAKQAYIAGGAERPLIEEQFGDYRPVDGVQVAFTAKVLRGGKPVLERRVTDITFNKPVDPALFKRPGP
jgi:zinc protease